MFLQVVSVTITITITITISTVIAIIITIIYIIIIIRSRVHCKIYHYSNLNNNQINAHALIGQPAMVHCTIKPMKKSRVF